MNKLFIKTPVTVLGFKDEISLDAGLKCLEENNIRVTEIYSSRPHSQSKISTPLTKNNYGKVAFYSGLGGFITACVLLTYFQLDYPLKYGIKPTLPLFSFIPLVFVFTILTAVTGLVFYYFITEHLLPGQDTPLAGPDISSDPYLVILDGHPISDTLKNILAGKATQNIFTTELRIQKRNLFFPITFRSIPTKTKTDE